MTAHETGEPFRQLCGGARARPRAGGGRRGGLRGQRPHDPGPGRDQGTRPAAHDGIHAERLGRSRLPNPDVIRGNHAREGGGAIFFVVGNNRGTLTIKDSTLQNNPSRGLFTAGDPRSPRTHRAGYRASARPRRCSRPGAHRHRCLDIGPDAPRRLAHAARKEVMPMPQLCR